MDRTGSAELVHDQYFLHDKSESLEAENSRNFLEL